VRWAAPQDDVKSKRHWFLTTNKAYLITNRQLTWSDTMERHGKHTAVMDVPSCRYIGLLSTDVLTLIFFYSIFCYLVHPHLLFASKPTDTKVVNANGEISNLTGI